MLKRLFHKSYTVAPMLSAGLLLSACGGGGGGGAPASTTDPGTDPVSEGAQINSISGLAIAPSKIQVLFQALNEDGEPESGLDKSDFTLTVDDADITDDSESFTNIATATGLGFSLPTVFVLDISSSVSDNDLQSAIDGLRSLLLTSNNESRLTDGQSVAIVVFDGNVTTQLNLTRSASSIDAALTDLSNLNRASRADSSATNLYGAASSALDLWQDSFTTANITQGYMVIIGDGADTSNQVQASEVINKIDTSGKRVVTIPTGSISQNGVNELSALASEPSFALGVTDFAQLGQELATVGRSIEEILGSLYVLEFVTSARAGNIDFELEYSSGEGTPSIQGEFSANGFSGTPRELRINNHQINTYQVSGIGSATSLNNPVVNVKLGDTLALNAETKWTNNAGSFLWSSGNNNGEISLPSNLTTDQIVIEATSNGYVDLSIEDTVNQVGGGDINQVQGDIRIFVSETEVTATNLSIPTSSPRQINLVASSSAANTPSFTWSTSNASRCQLSRSSGNEVTVTDQTSSQAFGTCSITVTDNANGSTQYFMPLSFGIEGNQISLSDQETSEVDFDFETGAAGDTRFGSWQVVSSSDAQADGFNDISDNGNYVLRAPAIGDNGTTSFSFTSSETSRIVFDYKTSSESGLDRLVFKIDGVTQLSSSGLRDWATFDSGNLAAGEHTFTWSYEKDGSVSTSSDTVWLDNFIFE